MSNVVNSYRFGGAAPSFSFNNALLFDGTNDIVTFTGYGSNTTSWSFSGWFNSSTIATTNNAIISNDAANYYILVRPTSVIVRCSTQQIFTVPSFSNNTWYHIAVFVSANSCRVFVNNTESSSGALTIGTQSSAFPLKEIGRRYNNTQYMTGKLDEMGYWPTYTFTTGDVSTLYNSGNGASCLDVSSGNLHFNYHLDETGTATTATDSSSAGNNGTLNNFPASGMWVTH